MMKSALKRAGSTKARRVVQTGTEPFPELDLVETLSPGSTIQGSDALFDVWP
jgi:hypothetical protein